MYNAHIHIDTYSILHIYICIYVQLCTITYAYIYLQLNVRISLYIYIVIDVCMRHTFALSGPRGGFSCPIRRMESKVAKSLGWWVCFAMVVDTHISSYNVIG